MSGTNKKWKKKQKENQIQVSPTIETDDFNAKPISHAEDIENADETKSTHDVDMSISMLASEQYPESSPGRDNKVLDNFSESNTSSSPPFVLYSRLLLLRFFSSKLWETILIILFLAPFVLVAIVNITSEDHLKPIHRCRGCDVDIDRDIPVLLAAALITLIGGIWAGLRVLHQPDPLGVSSEARMAFMYGGGIGIIGFSVDNFNPDIRETETFRANWILNLGLNIMFFIAGPYQVYQAYKEKSKFEEMLEIQKNEAQKLQNSLSSKEDASMNLARIRKDILELVLNFENESLREAFNRQLENEFASDSLRFYVAVSSFKKDFFNRTENTRKLHARRIVKTYIVSGSPVQVNISSIMRENLEKRTGYQAQHRPNGILGMVLNRNESNSITTDFVDNEDVSITVDMFDEVTKDLVQIMANGGFVKFLNTHFDEIMKLDGVKSLLENTGHSESN